MNRGSETAASLQQTVTFNARLNRIGIITAALILLTSSFDVFLVWEAGGNYRFCQLITPVLVVLALSKAMRGRTIPVLGFVPLSIWLCFQLLFIPSTDFWPKSLGYCVWLSVNLSLIFAFVQLFGDNRASLLTVLRWYLYSFGILATFGIVQFFLPVLDLPALFIQQWWMPGELARVNGLSYEPSYFATYLLTGFVVAGYLRRCRSFLLPQRTLVAIHVLTGLGIILSSSRMGIVFLFIEVFMTQLKPWASLFAGMVKRRVGIFQLRPLVTSFLFLACISTIAISAAAAIRSNPAIAFLFLNGTGISNTASHSVVQREDAFQDTVSVFLKHPLIGTSLGGVSAAIADLEGQKIRSFRDSKQFEGMSVFAEALAASGVIGVVPFIWFVTTTVRKPLRVAQVASPFYRGVLYALLRSLVYEWAILQFNQNMLRPYLWTHIAILAAVYAQALQSLNAGAGLRHSR